MELPSAQSDLRIPSPSSWIPKSNSNDFTREAVSSSSTLTLDKMVSDGAEIFPITPLKSSGHDRVERNTTGASPIFPEGRHEDKNMTLTGNGYSLPGTRVWTEYIHPDGRSYFYHKEYNIVTEVNVTDRRRGKRLEVLHGILREELQKYSADTNNYELYLGLDSSGDKCFYYYVDHNAQDIFWLEDIDLQRYGLAYGDDPWNNGYDFILRNYYRHLENFPCHNDLPPDASMTLHGILVFTYADHLTSCVSATTPWDAKAFLEILGSVERNHEKYGKDRMYDSSYRTWLVARLLCIVLHSKSVHRYGMAAARSDRLTIFSLMSGILTFFGHFTYMVRLQNVRVEGTISFTGWQSLLNSLLAEWSDSNLLATVIFSANMVFLALNGVTMVARVSSILSTFFSIGSIVIGLHHIWRHRNKRDFGAMQAVRNAARRTGSLTFLAIFLSLPLILVSWSLVAFACSVALYTFQNARPVWNYGIAGALMASIISLVISRISLFHDIFVYQ